MNRWGILVAVAASLACPPCEATAAGTGLRPLGLQVGGGEESWHTEREFTLGWGNPPPEAGLSVAAVHYRVRGAADAVVVGETRIGWPVEIIDRLRVPPEPGVYTAEVWLEDSSGDEGAAAAAKLRFDDVRPGHVDPVPFPGWISRTAFPYLVRLGHPAGPEPASGIAGYAVSIDRTPDGDPCAAADRCTATETDLRGGAAEASLPIAELPEGTSYVHAVAASGSGMRSIAAGHIALRVDKTDPVTRLAGAPGGWAGRPVTLTATATDAASGMEAPSVGVSPFTAIRIDGGSPVVAAGDSVTATVIGAGVHTVAYYARDAAGNVDDGGGGGGQPNRAPAMAVVRIDPDPPRVAFSNSQNPRAPETVEARVSDPLSGPDPSRGRIAVRRAGSGDPFQELPTEVDGEELRARWDSDAYPAAEYEFRATGYDTVGNATSTSRRANGSSMTLRNPLKAPTRLLAGFAGGRPARYTVPYGRGSLFAGRLIAGRRAPLVGVPVQVIERFEAGSSPRERVSTVRTGAGGAFSARLAPGPSREVLAAMPGTATLGRSASRTVELGVRGGLRMRASSAVARVGGPPVVFKGTVAGGGAIPPGGKLVQLQFRLPGLPWTAFRTVQTDPRGRFRYAYGFSDDDSRGARFQFRAYAPAQSGWPFEPAGSRPIAVWGR